MKTTDRPAVAVGDTIEVTGHRVGDAARSGEIEEVLGSGEHPHYRVRWEDGHSSLLFPGSDTRITRKRRPTRRRRAPSRALVESLRDAGIEFELLPHKRTESAVAEARELGVLPQETAKTIVLRTGGGFVRSVIRASDRLDLLRLRETIGVPDAELATEAELRSAYPEFELGAVPPFGGERHDRVVVDVELCGCEFLVLEAGRHDESLRLRTADLLQVADAEIARISGD